MKTKSSGRAQGVGVYASQDLAKHPAHETLTEGEIQGVNAAGTLDASHSKKPMPQHRSSSLISGKLNEKNLATIEKQNAEFMNRVFRIYCRDNQYQGVGVLLSQDGDSQGCHSEEKAISYRADSTTTMFNRSPNMAINPLFSGKYRQDVQALGSQKIVTDILMQKRRERRRSFSRSSLGSSKSRSVSPSKQLGKVGSCGSDTEEGKSLAKNQIVSSFALKGFKFSNRMQEHSPIYEKSRNATIMGEI